MRVMLIGAAAIAMIAVAPAGATELKWAPKGIKIYRGIEAPPHQPEDPAPFRSKREVSLATSLPAGSILVRTAERRLYFILGGGRAIRYKVGVGREGFTWSGRNRLTRMEEWPEWRPPRAMLIREEKKGRTLPRIMPGSGANPLGARALYIGTTEYRIHGTIYPQSVGYAGSSGCIRMLNEEVIDLYDRVRIGALVVVE